MRKQKQLLPGEGLSISLRKNLSPFFLSLFVNKISDLVEFRRMQHPPPLRRQASKEAHKTTMHQLCSPSGTPHPTQHTKHQAMPPPPKIQLPGPLAGTVAIDPNHAWALDYAARPHTAPITPQLDLTPLANTLSSFARRTADGFFFPARVLNALISRGLASISHAMSAVQAALPITGAELVRGSGWMLGVLLGVLLLLTLLAMLFSPFFVAALEEALVGPPGGGAAEVSGESSLEERDLEKVGMADRGRW